MLFDVNAWVGRWPFHDTASSYPTLIRSMDTEGISQALVSTMDGIFYDDGSEENLHFLEEFDGYPRIHMAGILNPSLPNGSETLSGYISRGVRAVRFLPNYHGYSLSDPAMRRSMETLGRAGILPVIQVRMQDERGHHPRCVVPPADVNEIIELANAFPHVPMLASSLYYQDAVLLGEKTENVSVEISGIERLNTVASLLESIPAERILLGSHFPFFYSRAAIMKVTAKGIDEKARKMIAGANAIRLLGLNEPG